MSSRIVVEGRLVAVTAEVSLRQVTDDVPGIARIRRTKGFRYVDARGKPARDGSYGETTLHDRHTSFRGATHEVLRRVRHASEPSFDVLRAIEPVVARYRDAERRRRHA